MTNKTLLSVENIKDDLLITELSKRGYIIIKDESSAEITCQSIIDFFYAELSKVCGESKDLYILNNEVKDIKAINRFLNKARRGGITKKEAIIKLFYGIKLFYKYQQELNISPITSISFLLNKCSWVFYKIFAIHKEKMIYYERSEESIRFKESIWDDLDSKFFLMQQQLHKKYLEND